MSVRILIGDCTIRLRELPDASVDSVVCDPPYHLTSIVKRYSKGDSKTEQSLKLHGTQKVSPHARTARGFMGQTWDGGDVAFRPETWAEVIRVLKPGGHLIAFSGTRTYHRLACAVEDAGFEIRDMLSWLYGSGFPKSHDVSKGIDKARDDTADFAQVSGWLRDRLVAAGVTPKVLNERFNHKSAWIAWTSTNTEQAFKPRIPSWDQWLELKEWLAFGDQMDAEVWRLSGRKGKPGDAYQSAEIIGTREALDIRNGRGRALGSALFAGEKTGKITLEERAPNSDAAREWEGWGTALKPACEPIVLARKPLIGTVAANVLAHGTGALNIDGCRIEAAADDPNVRINETANDAQNNFGGGTDNRDPRAHGTPSARWPANIIHDGSDEVVAGFPESDSGIAVTRNGGGRRIGGNGIYGGSKPHEGLPDSGYSDFGSAARFFYCAKATTDERGDGNNHPTVKPVALMRWLVRLITPKGGTILDPFMGSGSTMIAADAEQFNAIGCELSPDYAAIAEKRIRNAAGMFADVQIDEPKAKAA